MKNDSSVKSIIITSISLFLICGLCSGLLALTNSVTKDKIAENAVKTAQSARVDAVPGAASFSEEHTAQFNGTDYIYYDALDESGAVIAYVFTVTTKGYGGDLTVMVGISCDGLITGVKPTVLNETAGLGMKASGAEWLAQYTGKSAGIAVNKNAPADGANEIQAITSATITSKAVTQGVNLAFDIYGTIKEGTNNG